MKRWETKYDNKLLEQDEEISRIRDHSKKSLAQIMKENDGKRCNQKLEQENIKR